MLSAWKDQAIDLSTAETMLKTLSYLPKKTVETLFSLLPEAELTKDLSRDSRQIIEEKQKYLHKLQNIYYISALLRSLGSVSLIIIALQTSSIFYLLGIILIFIYKKIEIILLKKQWKKNIINIDKTSDTYHFIQNFDTAIFS